MIPIKKLLELYYAPESIEDNTRFKLICDNEELLNNPDVTVDKINATIKKDFSVLIELSLTETDSEKTTYTISDFLCLVDNMLNKKNTQLRLYHDNNIHMKNETMDIQDFNSYELIGWRIAVIDNKLTCILYAETLKN